MKYLQKYEISVHFRMHVGGAHLTRNGDGVGTLLWGIKRFVYLILYILVDNFSVMSGLPGLNQY